MGASGGVPIMHAGRGRTSMQLGCHEGSDPLLYPLVSGRTTKGWAGGTYIVNITSSGRTASTRVVVTE